jgi:predicted ATP-binding protein involved in virulence
MTNEEKYRQIKETIRHNYMRTFNTKLDDDILYILVAISEMNKTLSKQIKAQNQPKIASKSDLIVWNLSKYLKDFIYLAIIAGLVIIIIFQSK